MTCRDDSCFREAFGGVWAFHTLPSTFGFCSMESLGLPGEIIRGLDRLGRGWGIALSRLGIWLQVGGWVERLEYGGRGDTRKGSIILLSLWEGYCPKTQVLYYLVGENLGWEFLWLSKCWTAPSRALGVVDRTKNVCGVQVAFWEM